MTRRLSACRPRPRSLRYLDSVEGSHQAEGPGRLVLGQPRRRTDLTGGDSVPTAHCRPVGRRAHSWHQSVPPGGHKPCQTRNSCVTLTLSNFAAIFATRCLGSRSLGICEGARGVKTAGGPRSRHRPPNHSIDARAEQLTPCRIFDEGSSSVFSCIGRIAQRFPGQRAGIAVAPAVLPLALDVPAMQRNNLGTTNHSPRSEALFGIGELSLHRKKPARRGLSLQGSASGNSA